MSKQTASQATVPKITVVIKEADSPPSWILSHLRNLTRPVFTLIGRLYNFCATVLILAIVAAIPVLNFWTLGYLLDAQGRLARTGRWRNAFPDTQEISRICSILLGILICLFPLKLLASAAADARLIDAGSAADLLLHRSLIVCGFLMTVHLCLALARGGRLSCFFRPFNNLRWLLRQIKDRKYREDADTAIRRFLESLQIGRRFSLGLRGFAGAFLWLVLPTSLFATADNTQGGAVLVTLLGGILLIPVLAWLPLLQAHFSAENRVKSIFELHTARQLYRRAPILSTLAIFMILLFSLPLYLAKTALPPQDAMWLVTLVFILSIYPVKLFTGWVYYRASQRETVAWWGFRWSGRLLMIPALAIYIFLLLFTQGLGEHGKRVLFEHHAFLLPVPF